jgi:hypothetical protein
MRRPGTSVLIAGVLIGLLVSTPVLAGQGGFLPDSAWLAQAQAPGEREISLGEPGAGGTPAGFFLQNLQISGFVVGSFSYNLRIQMVPEFAGGAQALADPDATNFRFDKVGVALSRRFAPWLSASGTTSRSTSRRRRARCSSSGASRRSPASRPSISSHPGST